MTINGEVHLYGSYSEISIGYTPKVNKVLSLPSLRCVTYLYYDPNLNCCCEKNAGR